MKQNDLLQKWLADELSVQEKQDFEQSADFELYSAIIEEAQHYKASHFVKTPSFEDVKDKMAIPSSTTSERKVLWLRYTAAIAASVLIILGVIFFLNTSETIYETTVAQKETVVLPDNSQVILNAVSQLSYDSKKWNENRRLRLEGEAFFDVEKGAQFDVKTSVGTVSVLGTEFSVKQRGTFLEVYCYEGKVAVTAAGKQEILLPGRGVVVRNGLFLKKDTDKTYPSWKDGMSSFENIPFAEVVAELQRQFDVKITINEVDGEKRFTGSFEHINLEEAIQSVVEPLRLSYTIKDSKKVIIQ